MARTRNRRIETLLAALALLAGCEGTRGHNSAENEFTAWANGVEAADANGQQIPDFEEPANVMARTGAANAH